MDARIKRPRIATRLLTPLSSTCVIFDCCVWNFAFYPHRFVAFQRNVRCSEKRRLALFIHSNSRTSFGFISMNC